MNREEIIAAIKTTTEELGRVPTLDELVEMKRVSQRGIRRRFGAYRAALAACGLERSGAGYTVSREEVFRSWAGVVRRLGKVPSIAEYEMSGGHVVKTVTRQFGGWPHVAGGMAKFAKEQGMEDEWKDVLEVVAGHLQAQAGKAREPWWQTGTPLMPGLIEGEPVYGEPVVNAELMLAPTNEQGVIFLFGAIARRLGFVVLRVQTEYPDCEALRETAPGKWQRIPIEFEHESKNFLLHGHVPEKCRLIVCWRHNWAECPVEVLELRTVLRKLWPLIHGMPGQVGGD